jgi:alkanesulfonate monooxygenase SsuD/methylene tetrahydromethanopterin reductase-like flavin-dependent oxidoreductase (luciferase family)
MDRPDLVRSLDRYREAWRAAGHEGDGDVYLRIPVFVGESDEQAHADAQESTMRSYQRMARNFADSSTVAGAAPSEERLARGQRLAEVTYEDLLRDRLAYGGPESVAALLREIVEELDLSGVIAETNVGGLIPKEKVLASIARFGGEVVPVLRGLET